MLWFWIGFLLVVITLLTLDLGVFHRKAHAVKAKEAFMWTGFWISLAMAFSVFIYFAYEKHWLGLGLGAFQCTNGADAAIKYLTGYIIEESLSLDNIFVIALIFTYFKVPPTYQHRVLYWGILGAIIMRGFMILVGTALIHKFSWMTYIFGAILVFSAAKLMVSRHDTLDPEEGAMVKFFRKRFQVTNGYVGTKFFVTENGIRKMTPLFLVLIVIETTDLLFAVDSIPAIFAITTDSYIVFTSNIFAILGLRSLYFALAALIDRFRYIRMSLVFVLAYVGIKMILSHAYPIPTLVSLAIIGTIIFVGILASLRATRNDDKKLKSPLK